MASARNIKSRANRQNVVSALTSASHCLKRYGFKAPKMGLVLYCGVTKGSGKVVVEVVPERSIGGASMYRCDSKFHTQILSDLLVEDDTFGFVIVDGHGTLCGTLCGVARKVLTSFTVDLPNKHRRGGQSALRFARLRLEARRNYIRKVSEVAQQCFVAADGSLRVAGLVLGGSGNLKEELLKFPPLHQGLRAAVLKLVDTSYGGESGFLEAIRATVGVLGNCRLRAQQQGLAAFYQEVALESGLACYGPQETMWALQLGAIRTLLVHDELDLDACVTLSDNRGDPGTVYLPSSLAAPPNNITAGPAAAAAAGAAKASAEVTIVQRSPLLDLFLEELPALSSGTELQLVSPCTAEGRQFVLGFGGLAAMLRWPLDFSAMEEQQEQHADDGCAGVELQGEEKKIRGECKGHTSFSSAGDGDDSKQ